jgi:hypothetical protein
MTEFFTRQRRGLLLKTGAGLAVLLAPKQSKAVPVSGRRGLWDCGMFEDFTDGGKVVTPTHRPRSAPQKHYSSAPGTHLCSLFV